MNTLEIIILAQAIVVPNVFVIITFIICKKRITKKPVIIPVEYKPPKGLNSAEAGYIFHDYGSYRNIISLIPYLASKGYLKIVNVEKGKNDISDDTIIVLKQYNGDDEIEKTFMKYLVSACVKTKHPGAIGEISSRKIRKIIDDKNITIEYLLRKKTKSEDQNKVKGIGIVFAFVIIAICAIVAPFAGILTPIIVFIIFIASGIVFGIPQYKSRIMFVNGRSVKSSHPLAILYGLVLPIAIAFSVIVAIIISFNSNLIKFLPSIINLPSIIYLYICLYKLDNNLSEEEMKTLCKILGYRKYLQSVEKDRIKYFAVKNPSLYYEIMAYSYALEVATDWTDEFEVGIIGQE